MGVASSVRSVEARKEGERQKWNPARGDFPAG